MTVTRRDQTIVWSLAAVLGLIVVGHVSAEPPPAPQPPAAAPIPATATGPDLPQLMAAFARMSGLEASFVEEKRLGLLARPLESRGRLYFARPGLLLRRVESPQRSEVVITPKELKLRDADGEQVLDLRSRPDIGPFVESLSWLFLGDQKKLSAVYKLEFVPGHDKTPWQLTLVPKADPLVHIVTHIRMLGSGLAVSEIQIREKSGDETLTHIIEANPTRQFSREELLALFGVQPQAAAATGGKP
ncbi:MAG: outer membrane lipoprotein carrier protein LolA [Polyangiales bacterium]